MDCALCEREIESYLPQFHHLKLNENRSVDICSDCITTFVAWQGKTLATLFPTSMMKRRYGKPKEGNKK